MATQSKSGIVININRDSPKISFLIFADDCTSFCRTNKRPTN